MTSADLAAASNGQCLELDAIPQLAIDAFQRVIISGVSENQRVAAFFAAASEQPDSVGLFVVLADDAENRLGIARTSVQGDRFPSLTRRCPQVHLFEREIAEQFGLRPEDHPWLKPVRYR